MGREEFEYPEFSARVSGCPPDTVKLGGRDRIFGWLVTVAAVAFFGWICYDKFSPYM